MTNNPSQMPSHELKIKWVTRIAWGCVILGALASSPAIRLLFKGNAPNLSDLSSLGSYLQGAVQSLWALASFLFIYVAFLGQKQQAQLQAEQFAAQQHLQKAELEDQAHKFKLQQDSIKLQNFETSFFQLLNLHNQIVSEMEHRTSVQRHGRRSFEGFYDSLMAQFSSNDEQRLRIMAENLAVPWSLTAEKELVIRQYLVIYAPFQGSLGHYFRTLYHIIKFVKDSGYDYRTQRRYTSLVRAQLSAYELVMLFYNGITPMGEKFKPLIEEFALLEHLEKSLLQHSDFQHQLFYERSAYH